MPKIHIQDPDGALTLFSRRPLPPVRPGDRVTATGRIGVYAGTVQLTVDTLLITGRGEPPPPLKVKPESLISTRYSARLVVTESRVVDVRRQRRSMTVLLQAGDQILTVYLGATQLKEFSKTSFVPGSVIEVTGISSQFDREFPFTSDFQLLPRTHEDIRLRHAAPMFTRRQVGLVVGAAVGATLLFVLWVLLLRRQVRKRTVELERITESLRNEERHYRELFERNAAGQFRAVDDSITDMNASMLSMLGYSSIAALGTAKLSSIYWDPRDRETVVSALSMKGACTNLHVRLRRSNNTAANILMNASSSQSDDGGQLLIEGTVVDISATREAEERNRILAHTLESSHDAITVTDLNDRITYVNRAFLDLYGYELQDVLGQPITLVNSERNDSDIRAHISTDSRTVGWSGELLNLRSDGTEFPVSLSTSPIYDDQRNVIGLVGVARDITREKATEARIAYQAFHDSLTSLPNRALFVERLDQAIRHAARKEHRVALMFLDVDLFKRVNDTLGHSAGDELLKQIAERLRPSPEDQYSVARVGGDEFMLLLADLKSNDAPVTVARQVISRIAEPFHVFGQELYVTSSIGIATYPMDGTDPESLFRSADVAMYRAKDLGRNRFEVCSPLLNPSRAMERLATENDLRRALSTDQIVVYYQPQIELMTGAVIGFEALVRWNHPTRGVILPGDFLGLAEDSGLIVPIGEAVLRTACADARRWLDEGHPPRRVAVNLSARQFHSGNLHEIVAAVLLSTGLPPELLEVEIVETIAMENTGQALATLTALQNMGVRIAMDDFGTGQSSLSYLKRFPIDTVKIDRSFIRDVTTDESDAAIVSAVIAMSHRLQLHVIAEGVETLEQVEFLRRFGCEAVQGFLFSVPIAPADFGSYLERLKSTPLLGNEHLI